MAFEAGEYQEMFSIYDYIPSSKVTLKYKARRNGLPVLLQIHPFPPKTDIHDQSLCPGAFRETEVMERTTDNLLTLVFVEKLGDSIVYRSRECSLLTLNDERCDKCSELLDKLCISLKGEAATVDEEKEYLETYELKGEKDTEIISLLEDEDDGVDEADIAKTEHEDDTFVKIQFVNGRTISFEPAPKELETCQGEVSGFMCDLCNKSFMKERYLKDHLRRTHKQKSALTSNKCGKSFQKEQYLKQPVQKTHEMTTKWPCDQCGKVLSSRHDILRHIESVHGEERQCPLCDKNFHPRSAKFIGHLKYEHADSEVAKQFLNENFSTNVCQHCGDSFFTKQELSNHLRTDHPMEDESNNPCPTCGNRYSNDLKLKEHMKIHERNECHCTKCGKTFINALRLKTHKRFCLVTNQKVKCTQCDMEFNSRQVMKNHVRRVHLGVNYPCPICDKTFNTRRLLRSHDNNIHKGLKCFICEVCGYSCTSLHILNVHRNSSHKLENIKIAVFKDLVMSGRNPFCKEIHESIRSRNDQKV